MEEKTFLTVDEVAELLSVSKSKAYEIVRQLNKELKAKGLITAPCHRNLSKAVVPFIVFLLSCNPLEFEFLSYIISEIIEVSETGYGSCRSAGANFLSLEVQ